METSHPCVPPTPRPFGWAPCSTGANQPQQLGRATCSTAPKSTHSSSSSQPCPPRRRTRGPRHGPEQESPFHHSSPCSSCGGKGRSRGWARRGRWVPTCNRGIWWCPAGRPAGTEPLLAPIKAHLCPMSAKVQFRALPPDNPPHQRPWCGSSPGSVTGPRVTTTPGTQRLPSLAAPAWFPRPRSQLQTRTGIYKDRRSCSISASGGEARGSSAAKERSQNPPPALLLSKAPASPRTFSLFLPPKSNYHCRRVEGRSSCRRRPERNDVATEPPSRGKCFTRLRGCAQGDSCPPGYCSGTVTAQGWRGRTPHAPKTPSPHVSPARRAVSSSSPPSQTAEDAAQSEGCFPINVQASSSLSLTQKPQVR